MVQGVQEDVDGGEVAAWEDVAVDEGRDVAFGIMELVAAHRMLCLANKRRRGEKGGGERERERPTWLVMVIPSITILPSTGCNKLEITPK